MGQDRDRLFRSHGPDLNQMTTIYESMLDILNMYVSTKNELSRSRLSKDGAKTRQTDT